MRAARTERLLIGGTLGLVLSVILAEYYSESLRAQYQSWSIWRSVFGSDPNLVTSILGKVSWSIFFVLSWWMLWKLDFFWAREVSLPKDADEVDAALRSFTAALEHAATDDTTNGTNLTNATTPKVAEKSAHDSEHKAAKKAKGPDPGLNESAWQDLSGLGNATDATKCVAVCGQKTSDDHWCVTNCGGTPPNCPAALCTCAADAPNCAELEAKAAKKAEEEAKAARVRARIRVRVRVRLTLD